MTENEVTVMLAEAIDQDKEYKSWHVSTKHLMTFANLVAAKEREACAKLAMTISEQGLPEEMPEGDELLDACKQIAGGVLIAEAIRARTHHD
jgi:hypothetical protein